jgi:hypothetical protein
MRQKNTFLAALTILGFASLNLVHAGSLVLWSSAGSAGQVDPAFMAFAKTSRSEITMSAPGRLVVRYSVAPSAEFANVYGTLHLTGSFTDPGDGASVTLQLREDDIVLGASNPRVILSLSSKDGASTVEGSCVAVDSKPNQLQGLVDVDSKPDQSPAFDFENHTYYVVALLTWDSDKEPPPSLRAIQIGIDGCR